MAIKSYATMNAKEPLQPFEIERRAPLARDVVIDILYCGVCHSDVHQARNEWGNSIFPMVPGHEIVGKVAKIGPEVKRFQEGDIVGVGCFTDSCRECAPCLEGLQQYCTKGPVLTYNGHEKDGKTPTYGGYSTQIVVDENYVLSIPDNMKLDQTAPLLCAGITTYSPMITWGVSTGDNIGVIGLGGLGHMAIKIAHALGAEVTVFSTSQNKEADAKRLGATHFVYTKTKGAFDKLANKFSFIINTAAGDIDLAPYLNCLQLDGTMVIVGVPEKPTSLNTFPLIAKRRRLAGSLIGGIEETQDMLDFCALHNIGADIELIPIDKINEAYDRMVKNDVHYRFVIDVKNSLG